MRWRWSAITGMPLFLSSRWSQSWGNYFRLNHWNCTFLQTTTQTLSAQNGVHQRLDLEKKKGRGGATSGFDGQLWVCRGWMVVFDNIYSGYAEAHNDMNGSHSEKCGLKSKSQWIKCPKTSHLPLKYYERGMFKFSVICTFFSSVAIITKIPRNVKPTLQWNLVLSPVALGALREEDRSKQERCCYNAVFPEALTQRHSTHYTAILPCHPCMPTCREPAGENKGGTQDGHKSEWLGSSQMRPRDRTLCSNWSFFPPHFAF